MLELATSTLAMFSQRPSVGRALLDAGVTTLAVKLLSPLLPTVRARAACVRACVGRVDVCVGGRMHVRLYKGSQPRAARAWHVHGMCVT